MTPGGIADFVAPQRPVVAQASWFSRNCRAVEPIRAACAQIRRGREQKDVGLAGTVAQPPVTWPDERGRAGPAGDRGGDVNGDQRRDVRGDLGEDVRGDQRRDYERVLPDVLQDVQPAPEVPRTRPPGRPPAALRVGWSTVCPRAAPSRPMVRPRISSRAQVLDRWQRSLTWSCCPGRAEGPPCQGTGGLLHAGEPRNVPVRVCPYVPLAAA